MATDICVFNPTSRLIDVITGTATGPGVPGSPVVLNTDGLIDSTLTQQGITAIAGETIQPGSLVGLYDNGGVLTVQMAYAASIGTAPSGGLYPVLAAGFVAALTVIGHVATVSFVGIFSYSDLHGEFSAGDLGAAVYLSAITKGGITKTNPTPPDAQQSVGHVLGYNAGTNAVTVLFLAGSAGVSSGLSVGPISSIATDPPMRQGLEMGVNYWTEHYLERTVTSPTLNLIQSQNSTTLTIDDNALAGGCNFGDEYGAAGNKTTWAGFVLRHKGYTPGQHNVHGVSNEVYSMGDCIGHYIQSYDFGGQTNGADEGLEGVWENLNQGTIAYGGVLSVGGLGSRTVTIASGNSNVGAGKQGEGRYLINVTKAYGSGTITTIAGIGPVVYTGSGTAWPVSTRTTTSSAVTVTPGTAGPGSATVTVGSTAGMTTSTLVVVADAACFEMVIPTLVGDGTHFTATFRRPHPTGSIVAWGGLCGSFVELTADRWTTTNNGATPPLRQVWPIIASTSATTMQVWIAVHGIYDYYAGQAVISAGTNAYTLYPGAEVTSVQVGGAVSNTLGLAPNNVNWQVGDTVEQPLYPALIMPGNNWGFTRFFPSQGVAGGSGLSMSFSGIWANNDSFLRISNSTDPALYTSFGGTLPSPTAVIQFLGIANYGMYLATAPTTAAMLINSPHGAPTGLIGIVQVQADLGNADLFSYQNGTWRLSANRNALNFAFDNTYGIAAYGGANAMLSLFGSTSGHASIGVPAVAGSPSILLLPTTDPSAGQVLTAAAPSGGKMQTSWSTPAVSSAPQYEIPFYSAAGTASTLSGSNIVTDSTKNNLTVPAYLLVNTGGKAIALGGLNGSESSYAGLWLGATDRAAGDYAVISDGSIFTAVNCPTGGTVDFRGNNAIWGQVSITGFQCPTGGRGYFAAESTAPTGATGQDVLYADSTAHRWQMKNNNGTADAVVGAATTDVFTNKTLDTAGTGNFLKISGTGISAVVGTGSVVLSSNPTLTSAINTTGLSGAASLILDATATSTSNFIDIKMNGTRAATIRTNGSDLLLNPTSTGAVYLAYDAGTGGVNFGNGASGAVATVGSSGRFTKYNNATTAGIGVIPVISTDSQTALGADYNGGSAKTIITTPTAGSIFKVSGVQAVNVAGSVSSTSPSLTLGWTDAGGIARTLALVATSTTNTTAVITAFTQVIHTDGTSVTLTSAGYVSSGGTSMQYSLGYAVEQMA